MTKIVVQIRAEELKRKMDIRNGIDGRDAKPEDVLPFILARLPAPDTARIEKVEKDIQSVREMITNIPRRSMAGPNANAVQFYDITPQCNGVLTSFNVPKHRVALMLVSTQFPIIYRPTTDFTSGSGTIDLVSSQVSAPQTNQTLILLYIK